MAKEPIIGCLWPKIISRNVNHLNFSPKINSGKSLIFQGIIHFSGKHVSSGFLPWKPTYLSTAKALAILWWKLPNLSYLYIKTFIHTAVHWKNYILLKMMSMKFHLWKIWRRLLYWAWERKSAWQIIWNVSNSEWDFPERSTDVWENPLLLFICLS